MPLQRRLPKRGFHPPRRVAYAIVNLGQLAAFPPGSTVGPAELRARGIVRGRGPVKCLADAFRVLHGNAALGALHVDDRRHHADHDDRDEDRHQDRQFLPPDELEGRGDGRGHGGDDPGEDDERDAVADAAFGDLFAQPHDERRAGGEGDDRHEAEVPAGLEDDAAPAGRFDRLEAHRDEEALHEREDDRAVARVLRDLAPSELPLLGQLLQVRDHHREKLQDDARADVGHDAERKDREALERTAGEEVHQ
ncbi:MAG: hypothetical protein E6J76_02150, partial [Deltaproteobacteria bacterium]